MLCAPVGRAAARRRVPARPHATRTVQRPPIASTPSCSRVSSRPLRIGSFAATTGRRFDYTIETRETLRCPEIVGRIECAGARPAICLARRAAGRGCADHRPVGERQVDARPGDPQQQSAARPGRSSSSTARRSPRRCSRASCSAPSAARTRRRRASTRQGRGGRRRHAVPRRDRRAVRGRAGEAAPAARDARVPPARRDRRAMRADVRIISATNAILEARVAARQFREDLYYRMHVVPVECPASTSAATTSPSSSSTSSPRRASATSSTPLRDLAARARRVSRGRVARHTRQLAHAIEAAVIRAHGERALSLREHHIFPKAPHDHADAPTLAEATRAFQRRHIAQALEQHDWNVSETARALDITRSHLYTLINDLDLKRRAGAGGERRPQLARSIHVPLGVLWRSAFVGSFTGPTTLIVLAGRSEEVRVGSDQGWSASTSPTTPRQYVRASSSSIRRRRRTTSMSTTFRLRHGRPDAGRPEVPGRGDRRAALPRGQQVCGA